MATFRQRCLACDTFSANMTKEHVWPKWLIAHTNTAGHPIRWINGKMVKPLAATFPLCSTCNADFGKELEAPVSKIVEDIETGRGMSDLEAEYFVRWCWKIQGIFWRVTFPRGQYTNIYSLRERVLRPLDSIRSRLILAVGLIDDPHAGLDCTPMGFCSGNLNNAVSVVGVISRIAFYVSLDECLLVRSTLHRHYRLAEKSDSMSSMKVFFPVVTFPDPKSAIQYSQEFGKWLTVSHELHFQHL